MKYDLVYEKKAVKSLKKLDKGQQRMIAAWIEKNLVETDDFGITWNEEFKEKEEQRHFLKPADGIIQEIGKTSLMFMDKDNSQKEHHPDAYKYGILWLEVIIHTGKRFKSRKMITKITKNTEYDEKSPNFDPPKNENYYAYDRFGNLIHQPPEIKSNE